MTESLPAGETGATQREAWTQELVEAIEAFTSGESVAVLAEVDDGSAKRLLAELPESVGIFSRAVAASATRARVGAIAEELRVDEFVGGTALVLEEAQWADPTSLGRLQRMLQDESLQVLLVVAHRPLSEVDGWWFARLSDGARKHAHLFEVALQPRELPDPQPDLDAQSVDLVIATQLVAGPIPVRVAARLLGISEDEVLALGDELTQQGWVRQERGGFRSSADGSGFLAGDVRTGYVADKLADVMEEQGETASVVGNLRLASGQPGEAFPLLFEAAVEAENRHATGEAYHLAADAIQAAGEAGIEDDRLGPLHLICGRFLRSAGRTNWARSHLERATRYLEGEARVDALGFAAAVADDSQHPQEAERLIAIAEWEAERIGERAKVGSLWTFRALILNRIGFAEEADGLLAKGRALLEQGSSPHQRFRASQNTAWIHYDRGEAKLAEAEFTHLRDEARQLEGDVSVADKEAWRARSLFASGHPGQALEAIRYVEEVSAREGVEAPLFLSQLALADGSFTYGRYEEALAASERVLDLVQRQLPAWENMARSNRAHALMELGRLAEAREEIEAAIAASPPGADGWRWRIRCRALQMEIEFESVGRWDARDAEDLADVMLQSRFYHWAADLLCAIAKHGKRKSAASEAMAIALKVGRPMTAARAATIGGLWMEPAAAQAIAALRAMEDEIPEGWEDVWRALPWVAEGLQAPEPTEDVETEAATAALEDALRKAGLAGEDMVLSPAQRRSRGLVRRPRVLRPLQMVAAALAVVVLAGGTAFAVVAANTDSPSPATTSPPVAQETTVPEPLSLEETMIAAPERIAGTAEHRGGNGRTGFVESTGLRDVTGYFWRAPTAGAIEGSSVAFGQQIFVGSTDGTFYALAQDDGNQNWTKPAEGRISTAPALGAANFGEGPQEMMVVVVDDDGLVRAFRADNGTEEWREDLGSRIRSTPVIAEGRVYVGAADGFVHGFELTTGERLWTYPDSEEGIGAVSADLSYDSGFLYVGTEAGLLHVMDVTGETPSVCQFDAREAITVNPIVVGLVVYVPTNGQTIWTLPAGACEGVVPDRQPFYVTEAPISVAPAIVGDIIYLPTTRFLYAMDLRTFEFVWPADTVTGESSISAPPVVANDTVYFADEDGVVQGVDSATGELLWKWRTGLHVRGSPAVVDGAVFIVSGDTFVYAISDRPVLDDQG